MSDIILPHDTQAEVGIIGTLIENPKFCIQLSWLNIDYFYNLENKCLYWAITELAKQDIENIDDFNIIKKINENSGIKKIFDELKIPSIQDLLDNYKIIARKTFEEYEMLADRVMLLSYKRKAYKVSLDFANTCLSENEISLSNLNLKFHEEMNKLAEKFIINKEINLIGEVFDEVWSEIEQQRQNGLIGIPSKYDLINEYFTYQNSELVIVGGELLAA